MQPSATLLVPNRTGVTLVVTVEPWAFEYVVRARQQLRIDVFAPSTPILEVEQDVGFVTVAVMDPAGSTYEAVIEPLTSAVIEPLTAPNG